ncbi:MAG: propionate CoA-transferase [Desulforhopalus sp.]|jgi:propionate CoA-transferase
MSVLESSTDKRETHIMSQTTNNALGDLSQAMPQLRRVEIKKNKIVSAEEAVRIIRDNDTVAFGGFVGIGFAEEIGSELEQFYKKTKHPQDLTLVFAAGQGDGGERGLNHLAHPGLIKRIIGGHWGLAPKLQKMALENEIEAYNLPQGVISHLYRDIAGHKPGNITRIGLGTFVDPRNGGGKLNSKTTEDIIKLLEIEGEEYLLYRSFPINVAVIRGTTADMDGNITMEKEALTAESLSMAMAAKNSNGFVIAQVEQIAERGTLNSRQVKIPGILVDCIVVAKPENHWQTFVSPYNASYSGQIKIPMDQVTPMPLDPRKIIARRASFELKPNSVVNLGIGVPEGVACVANEEKILDLMTLTAEPGVIGGAPAGGLNFGAADNASAVIDQPYQFDFYDGGGLDAAFLGMAEVDEKGNINVSKFGPRLAGAGGFINISQNAQKVVFMGTFSAAGLQCSIDNGALNIIKEGKVQKFVKQVEQTTFSGEYGAKSKRRILYITERCVFSLNQNGLLLEEIAPGVDLEKDILSLMDFTPEIQQPLATMDSRIFHPEIMELKNDLLNVSVNERITYSSDMDIMFANLAGFSVKSESDIEAIKVTIAKLLNPLGRKVYAIGNYDGFNINPDLIDAYTEMQTYVTENYFTKVSRYTTSAFLRMKLGASLEKRGRAPHIYESKNEAHQFLLNQK